MQCITTGLNTCSSDVDWSKGSQQPKVSRSCVLYEVIPLNCSTLVIWGLMAPFLGGMTATVVFNSSACHQLCRPGPRLQISRRRG